MEERDFAEEARTFRQEHPQVEELSDRVTRSWAEGKPLSQAWEEEQQEQEAPAAVEPVTGQGGVEEPRTDGFLAGLETEAW